MRIVALAIALGIPVAAIAEENPPQAGVVEVTPEYAHFDGRDETRRVHLSRGQFVRVPYVSCASTKVDVVMLPPPPTREPPQGLLTSATIDEILQASSVKLSDFKACTPVKRKEDLAFDGSSPGFILRFEPPGGVDLGLPEAWADTDLEKAARAYLGSLDQKVLDAIAAAGNKREVAERIQKLDVADRARCLEAAGRGKVKEVKTTTLVVLVEAGSPYAVELAGAFNVIFASDPVYYFQTSTANGTSTYTLLRNTEAEDKARLGFAGFIHGRLFPRLPQLALTAGLGLNEGSGSRPSFFLGPSYRVGGQWFITAGLALTTETSPPNGIEPGKAYPGTPDPNALANLGRHYVNTFFLGVSYTFLSPGSEFFSGKLKEVKASTDAQGK